MAKSLAEYNESVKGMTDTEDKVDVSPEKAKKRAVDLQRAIYEAEKKTGAPVPSFKAWKALE